MEYGHGGDTYRNRNVELDFSVNVNPLGMPNFVWEAAQRSIAFCTGYPDSSCENLRGRLSEITGVPEDQMIFGNGAAELIFRLVQEVRPKKAVIPAPSFAEYETALRSCGTEIAFFYLKEAESFFLNISEFLDFLRAEQPEIIFLCTPANPTGAMIRQADLSKILDYCRKHGPCGIRRSALWNSLMRSEAAAVSANFSTGRPKDRNMAEAYFFSGHSQRHMPWRDCGWGMDSVRAGSF